MKKFDLNLAKTQANVRGNEVCNKKGEDMVIMNVLTSKQVLFPVIAKKKGSPDYTCVCYMTDGKWEEKESDNDLMLK